MPTVAVINGIKIELYFDEHPPPHFHARYAEFVAQIDLETLEIIKESMPRPQLRTIQGWATPRRGGPAGGLECLPWRRQSTEDRVTEIARIVSAEPVIHGVLKIEWNDGYAGIVDLRPVISRGTIFTYLENPENFQSFRIGEYGHALVWTNERGEEIDFGAYSLRQRAEKQAQILPG